MSAERASVSEREALMKLITCISMIEETDWTPIRERLSEHPDVYDQFLAAKTYLTKMAATFVTLLPPENWEYIKRNSYSMEVIFRPRTNVVRDPSWITITTDALAVLLKKTMESECGMCLKSDVEVKQCALRKTLIELVDEKEHPYCNCGYRRQ